MQDTPINILKKFAMAGAITMASSPLAAQDNTTAAMADTVVNKTGNAGVTHLLTADALTNDLNHIFVCGSESGVEQFRKDFMQRVLDTKTKVCKDSTECRDQLPTWLVHPVLPDEEYGTCVEIELSR